MTAPSGIRREMCIQVVHASEDLQVKVGLAPYEGKTCGMYGAKATTALF
jgi:hypothetical protein